MKCVNMMCVKCANGCACGVFCVCRHMGAVHAMCHLFIDVFRCEGFSVLSACV